MNDRLSLMGMYSGSRDLFNFWEISDSILDTMQDRDMVAIEV